MSLQAVYETQASAELKTQLPRPKLRQFKTVREILDFFILIGAISTLVNLATVRFVVQGPSMLPTFEENQYLIVSRVNYMLGNPERGDVMVFHFPNDPNEDYIKRIVGLPGDIVEIVDTQVYINGEPLEENYINEPCNALQCPNNRWELGETEYFMMGDNRNRSSDSRDFGPVDQSFIVGEVLLRYWPPEDWTIIGNNFRN